MFRLPDEILGEIFVRCSLYCADAPYILSTVCHTFRRVIYRTPWAWDRLQLVVHPTDDSQRHNVKKILHWLKLSGVCPLHVCVDIALDDEGHYVAPNSILIPTFRRCYPRMTSLQIRAEIGSAAQVFLDALGPDTDILQMLKVETTYDAPVIGTTFPLVPMHHLKTLDITNYCLPRTPYPDSPNFENLQKISIHRPLRASPLPSALVLRLLESAPSLQDIEIETRIVGPRQQGNFMQEITSQSLLPNVKRISLRTNNMSLLLGSLCLPSLEQMRLVDLNGRGQMSAQKLSWAMRRVLASMPMNDGLRKLDLVGSDLRMGSQTDWEWCWRYMNNLQELSIANTDADPIFGFLAATSCLPRLRNIRLSQVQSHLLEPLCTARPWLTVESSTIAVLKSDVSPMHGGRLSQKKGSVILEDSWY